MAARQELIFAITRVAGASAACKAKGDEAQLAQLQRYYQDFEAGVAAAQGHIVKVMGDAIIMTFPPHDPRKVIEALTNAQLASQRQWSAYAQDTKVEVKVGKGALATGRLGPKGREADDIVGAALNELFKAPWTDGFYISPQLDAVL